ncbi:major capsid protein [Rhodococcoides corynebacterioides]|uniref:major capsid protein n=1 Tax=Rhodococcoides corynebacterioides TaxID=53972 RepID=UPI003F8203D8
MPTPAPVPFPLGAPTLVGSTLTVDTALNQPARITKRIADMTLQKFIVDRIFASTGVSVASGAVLYDKVTANELYLTRDVEERAPGAEYPVVGGQRGEPNVAKSEDWGGKFFITDQAKKRNDVVHFNNQVTQLANTIVRKVNTRAVATLEAAISALGGAGVVPGHNWSNVTLSGTSPTPNNARPFADFANVQLAADREELGVTYDLWIVNPQEKANLVIAYGEDYAAALAAANIEIFDSNRVPAGTAYAVARGQVGFLDYEEGLTTETWREAKNRQNWVQSYVQPIMGVTNPYSIKKITGLAG